MESFMNINAIAKATGGEICNLTGNEIVKDIVRDDREVVEGAVFVALNGENNNGHRFVGRALEKGAICCIVNKDEGDFGRLPVLRVDDTYKALLDVASYYRDGFNIPVIGITGSVGKTSTKGMIASVLSTEYNTLKTEGNFNNEVGVPLTLFRLSDENEVAVIEMGMSGYGEISRLSKIVKPDTAVVTNIGMSHIEQLGSREGILKAKMEILDGLSIDGTVILNGDDDMLWSLNGELDYETLYFGIENKACDLLATDIKLFSSGSDFTVSIDGEDCRFETNVPGVHHIYNALAAILVGYRYNIGADGMKKGIHDFTSEGFRQSITQYEKFTVINDCYNACPDSMESGANVLLLTAKERGAARKVACLGDMLELGDKTVDAHRKVGRMCAEKKIDYLITVGEKAKDIAFGAKAAGMNPDNIFEFDTCLEAAENIGPLIQKGDMVWIKGSRGMRLERIADALGKIGGEPIPDRHH